MAMMAMIANAQVEIDGVTYRYYSEGDYIANEAWVVGVDESKAGEVVIPASIIAEDTEFTVAVVDENAFQNCSKMTALTLPSGILTIREDAFRKCDALKDLTLMATEPPHLNDEAFEKPAYSSVSIHVPAEALAAYQKADVWKQFSNILAIDPSYIPINEATFPDEVFRVHVKTVCDLDSDGKLSQQEIASVTNLKIKYAEIHSLKGIEYFTELAELIGGRNNLTELDLSKNTKLTYLSCYGNQLTELDFSNNTLLQEVYCHTNKLTKIDVSKCPDLVKLDCALNELPSIDVSNNPKLIRLNIHTNKLTSVDISKNTSLKRFYCGTNQLTSLDVSKNTELDSLTFNANQIAAIDVSKNTKLLGLVTSQNLLTSIDVSNNKELKQLWCHTNQLTSIDISKNTKLTNLSVEANNITSLDVTPLSDLDSLECGYNQISTLDVTKNPKLLNLGVSENQLTTLDVSKNTKLIDLYCYGNQLTSLDLSNHDALQNLYCQRNKLTSLTVSKNSPLIAIYCHRNQIQGEAMDHLIASLPNQENGAFAVFNTDYINEEGNVCTTTQVAEAKNKGWTAYHLYNDEWALYEGSDPSAISSVELRVKSNAPTYNLNGQRTGANHKGITIQDGRKTIVK